MVSVAPFRFVGLFACGKLTTQDILDYAQEIVQSGLSFVCSPRNLKPLS